MTGCESDSCWTLLCDCIQTHLCTYSNSIVLISCLTEPKVSHWTGGSSTDVLAVFAPLSAGVLYSTYRSCALIALDTLSLQRAERVVQHVLHHPRRSPNEVL